MFDVGACSENFDLGGVFILHSNTTLASGFVFQTSRYCSEFFSQHIRSSFKIYPKTNHLFFFVIKLIIIQYKTDCTDTIEQTVTLLSTL